jgi:hypothetical protein
VACESHDITDQTSAERIRVLVAFASLLVGRPQSGFRATDSVPNGLYAVVSIAKPAVETHASSSESCTATGDLMRDVADSNGDRIASTLPFHCGRLTKEWHRIQ